MQAQVQDQETTAVVTPARAGASDSTSVALARQTSVCGSCDGFRWAEVKNRGLQSLHFLSLWDQSRTDAYSPRALACPAAAACLLLVADRLLLTPDLLLCSARLALPVAAFPITNRRVRITGMGFSTAAARLAIRVALHAAVAAALPTTLERRRPLG